jgi:hypothetical protein
MPEPSSRHYRTVTWRRTRPEGYEGFSDGERFNVPPAP